MKQKNLLSLTIGITTCYGDPSILETIRSIRQSIGVGSFPIILIADRVPLTSTIKRELRKLKVRFVENKTEASQVTKQRQILRMTKTELLILTQDDVLFDRKALKETLSYFNEHKETTMISILNDPLPAKTIFEAILGIGTKIANKEALYWNRSDNFLSVIGRFMAFRTKTFKRFRLLDKVATSDTYYYLENKRVGGKYEYIHDVAVHFINPRNLKEHMRKSSRFQFSYEEMSHYFHDIANEYKTPKHVMLRSSLEVFLANPFLTLAYFVVFAYTRLVRMKKQAVLNPIWEVDISTKAISK